jgi:integrase/recombinase XerD
MWRTTDDAAGLRGAGHTQSSARLTLGDVDWKRERLQVLARKAGHATVYPLAGVVAEAIIDYLKHGRPKTEDLHLFFRTYAPQAPITYDRMASFLAPYGNRDALEVARNLDKKIEDLLGQAAV